MNKKILVALLIGGMLVGCSNAPKNNDSSSKDNTSKETTPKSKNDALEKGELTEDDIVSKTKETLGGQDVIKYVLKDGSVIITFEGDDDLNRINESIKNENKAEQKRID